MHGMSNVMNLTFTSIVEATWNVMAHAQKPDFVFWRNGQVHFNRQGCQLSWLLAAEVCASSVVMLDKPCSEVVWRVLATHSIRQFPLHFPSRASPRAITYKLESTTDFKIDGLWFLNVTNIAQKQEALNNFAVYNFSKIQD